MTTLVTLEGVFFWSKFWKIEIFEKITIVSLHERKTAAYFRGIWEKFPIEQLT